MSAPKTPVPGLVLPVMESLTLPELAQLHDTLTAAARVVALVHRSRRPSTSSKDAPGWVDLAHNMWAANPLLLVIREAP